MDPNKKSQHVRAYSLAGTIKALTVIAFSAFSIGGLAAQAEAPPVTITERQELLMKAVDKAEKSGELTLKEATSLRASEEKIVAKEKKMKDKNGGKLSYANINTVEKDLNKLSNKLHKLQLSKRVSK